MATVRSFRALRPSIARASSVAAVPYDVVSTEEARFLARGNPLSFLHVSRAEIDLPPGTDPYADMVYEKAAENFEELKKSASLELDPEERLYGYRLRMDGREQTGIAAICSLEEYDTDVIRKHERTRKEKEDDRTRHMLRLRAQTGPVFLAYRGRAAIDAIVEGAKSEPPLYDFVAPDGIGHAIWRLSAEDSRRLAQEFRRVPRLYIADGHHRAASASRARNQLGPGSGEKASDFFLAVAFPAEQLRILPYNRVVRDLAGRSPEQFLSALAERFPVREDVPASRSRKGEIAVYLAGRWHRVTLPEPAAASAIEALDADSLQRNVFEPILGIRDIRTEKRVDFVGGIRGNNELARLVDSGEFAAAFSLHPVSLDELMAIADSGQIMPPKSTWFEPKLRDGLLIHMIA